MPKPEFRTQQTGTRSQVKAYSHPLYGPLTHHRKLTAKHAAKLQAQNEAAAEKRWREGNERRGGTRRRGRKSRSTRRR
jgi:hypothetical protein